MYQEVFKLHSDLLKALAHPRRLEIIQLLREGELNVSQMQQMLGLPQANLSQHLMVLKENGVVEFKKTGKQVVYKLAHKNFVDASDLMRGILIERYKQDKRMASELNMKMHDLVPVVADPVCGMRVSPKTASYAQTVAGKNYYFCAGGCHKEFKKNQEKYLKR